MLGLEQFQFRLLFLQTDLGTSSSSSIASSILSYANIYSACTQESSCNPNLDFSKQWYKFQNKSCFQHWFTSHYSYYFIFFAPSYPKCFSVYSFISCSIFQFHFKYSYGYNSFPFWCCLYRERLPTNSISFWIEHITQDKKGYLCSFHLLF